MPVLDITDLDFSRATPDGQNALHREITVRNEDPHAVLHVGLKSPVVWLDLYPAEFALAPKEVQTVVAEITPENARNSALAPVNIAVFGQYISLNANTTALLPPDIATEIRVTPPISDCPNCGSELPEDARECRRCGERIRLCPFCGIPNTWLARTCRLVPTHIIRAESDWLTAPGGNAAHTIPMSASVGVHLARRWSLPSFPSSSAVAALEWSAPLAAFGMVVASAIDSAAARATVQAFELKTGIPLWELDLPDVKGLYPDRGSMALSSADGLLYAATLGGKVVAIDVIRGTTRWESKVSGTVFGGVVVADNDLLIPAGSSLCILDRMTGEVRRTVALGGRIDTAPAYAAGIAYIAGDDARVTAIRVDSGDVIWTISTDGPFDAAPLLYESVVYAATMSGSLYALSTETGAELWRTTITNKGIAVTPALSTDGLLFVAADDGYVHVVAADTGHLTRSRRVSSAPLRTSPVCAGQTVFVGSDDGNIYSLDGDYNLQRAYETTPGARIGTAGLALYGDTLVCAATNGVLYVLQMKG